MRASTRSSRRRAADARRARNLFEGNQDQTATILEETEELKSSRVSDAAEEADNAPLAEANSEDLEDDASQGLSVNKEIERGSAVVGSGRKAQERGSVRVLSHSALRSPGLAAPAEMVSPLSPVFAPDHDATVVGNVSLVPADVYVKRFGNLFSSCCPNMLADGLKPVEISRWLVQAKLAAKSAEKLVGRVPDVFRTEMYVLVARRLGTTAAAVAAGLDASASTGYACVADYLGHIVSSMLKNTAGYVGTRAAARRAIYTCARHSGESARVYMQRLRDEADAAVLSLWGGWSAAERESWQRECVIALQVGLRSPVMECLARNHGEWAGDGAESFERYWARLSAVLEASDEDLVALGVPTGNADPPAGMESAGKSVPTQPVALPPAPPVRETKVQQVGEVQPQEQSRSAAKACYKCGKTGHFMRQCRAKRSRESRNPIKCHNCGREGHIARFCRNSEGTKKSQEQKEDDGRRRYVPTPAQATADAVSSAAVRSVRVQDDSDVSQALAEFYADTRGGVQAPGGARLFSMRATATSRGQEQGRGGARSRFSAPPPRRPTQKRPRSSPSSSSQRPDGSLVDIGWLDLLGERVYERLRALVPWLVAVVSVAQRSEISRGDQDGGPWSRALKRLEVAVSNACAAPRWEDEVLRVRGLLDKRVDGPLVPELSVRDVTNPVPVRILNAGDIAAWFVASYSEKDGVYAFLALSKEFTLWASRSVALRHINRDFLAYARHEHVLCRKADVLSAIDLVKPVEWYPRLGQAASLLMRRLAPSVALSVLLLDIDEWLSRAGRLPLLLGYEKLEMPKHVGLCKSAAGEALACPYEKEEDEVVGEKVMLTKRDFRTDAPSVREARLLDMDIAESDAWLLRFSRRPAAAAPSNSSSAGVVGSNSSSSSSSSSSMRGWEKNKPPEMPRAPEKEKREEEVPEKAGKAASSLQSVAASRSSVVEVPPPQVVVAAVVETPAEVVRGTKPQSDGSDLEEMRESFRSSERNLTEAVARLLKCSEKQAGDLEEIELDLEEARISCVYIIHLYLEANEQVAQSSAVCRKVPKGMMTDRAMYGAGVVARKRERQRMADLKLLQGQMRGVLSRAWNQLVAAGLPAAMQAIDRDEFPATPEGEQGYLLWREIAHVEEAAGPEMEGADVVEQEALEGGTSPRSGQGVETPRAEESAETAVAPMIDWYGPRGSGQGKGHNSCGIRVTESTPRLGACRECAATRARLATLPDSGQSHEHDTKSLSNPCATGGVYPTSAKQHSDARVVSQRGLMGVPPGGRTSDRLMEEIAQKLDELARTLKRRSADCMRVCGGCSLVLTSQLSLSSVKRRAIKYLLTRACCVWGLCGLGWYQRGELSHARFVRRAGTHNRVREVMTVLREAVRRARVELDETVYCCRNRVARCARTPPKPLLGRALWKLLVRSRAQRDCAKTGREASGSMSMSTGLPALLHPRMVGGVPDARLYQMRAQVGGAGGNTPSHPLLARMFQRSARLSSVAGTVVKHTSPYVTVRFENNLVLALRALIDSGATHSCISQKAFERLAKAAGSKAVRSWPRAAAPMTITLANGAGIHPRGVVVLSLGLRTVRETVVWSEVAFIILDDMSEDVILGIDWEEQMGVTRFLPARVLGLSVTAESRAAYFEWAAGLLENGAMRDIPAQVCTHLVPFSMAQADPEPFIELATQTIIETGDGQVSCATSDNRHPAGDGTGVATANASRRDAGVALRSVLSLSVPPGSEIGPVPVQARGAEQGRSL